MVTYAVIITATFTNIATATDMDMDMATATARLSKINDLKLNCQQLDLKPSEKNQIETRQTSLFWGFTDIDKNPCVVFDQESKTDPGF